MSASEPYIAVFDPEIIKPIDCFLPLGLGASINFRIS